VRHIIRRFLGGEEEDSTESSRASDVRRDAGGARAPGAASSAAKTKQRKRSKKPSEPRPGEGAVRKRAESPPPRASGQSRLKDTSIDLGTLPETPFRGFGLDPRIEMALVGDLGFRTPTPVQEKALPHTLLGKDLTGKAQTGTGKTAAFLITIYQRMLHSQPEGGWGRPGALIIAPTRELAIQIDRDAAEIGKYCGIRHLVVYGGTDFEKQRKALAEGVDILAATPGRLLDFVRRGNLDLSGVRILVIDEADRMLDMGFLPDVRRILGRLPKPEKRQTLLFSATLSPDRAISMAAATPAMPAPATTTSNSSVKSNGFPLRVLGFRTPGRLGCLPDRRQTTHGGTMETNLLLHFRLRFRFPSDRTQGQDSAFRDRDVLHLPHIEFLVGELDAEVVKSR